MANFFQNNKYYLNHPEMQKNMMKKNSLIFKSPTFNRTFEHTTYSHNAEVQAQKSIQKVSRSLIFARYLVEINF